VYGRRLSALGLVYVCWQNGGAAKHRVDLYTVLFRYYSLLCRADYALGSAVHF